MQQKKKKRKKKKNPRESQFLAIPETKPPRISVLVASEANNLIQKCFLIRVITAKTPVVFSQFDCLKISVEILKNIRWHQTNRKYKFFFLCKKNIFLKLHKFLNVLVITAFLRFP